MHTRPRVILVDDNKDFVDMMSELLTYSHVENRVAYNGRDAVSLLLDWPAEIMLLDIDMPVMNGYETAITIHALKEFEQLPIVAWSATVNGKYQHFQDEARFSGWLAKPVGLQQVLDVIARLTWVENHT